MIEKLDKHALVLTKMLAKQRLRRVHAASPPIRVRGPLHQRAIALGVDFEAGLSNVSAHKKLDRAIVVPQGHT